MTVSIVDSTMLPPDKTDVTPDFDLSRSVAIDMDDEPTQSLASAPAPARDARHGKVIGGRYRVQERLGKGGMASVYRAVDLVNGSEYAVKILDPRYARDPSMARRSQREARAMADLANRHIPCAFLVGTNDEGETFIVMEFLRGRDLEQVIVDDLPFSWRRAFHIALQLCDALQAAHARNIIHRDVKPSNCFLIQGPSDGEDLVKLIDFGIAKDLAASGDPTGTGMVLGTPGYIAPELVTGDSAPSALTDVYALGVTLYKLLTNRLPWEGRSHVDIIVSQRRDPPQPIRDSLATAGRRIPRDAEVVIMTAFAYDPKDRFGSAQAFAAALRATLRKHPDDADLDLDDNRIAAAHGPDETGLASPSAPRELLGGRPLQWCIMATLSFTAVLLMVPPAPARPLAATTVRALAPPVPSRPPPPAIEPIKQPPPEPPPPEPPQQPKILVESILDNVDNPPPPKTRPFNEAAARKEIEGERAYLLQTCATTAPKRRSFTFTLVIAPSGALQAVEATPSRFRACIYKLWRDTHFPTSDTGGRYTHRLIVPEQPELLPVRLKP